MVATESRVIRLFKFHPVRAAFDLILRDKMVPALEGMKGVGV